MVRGTRGAGRARAGAASSTRQAADGTNPTTSRVTPAAGGSSTPTPTPTPGRGRGTTGRATRSTGPTTARFRPKNVRRDEAEREALVREEERKDSLRAAAEERGKRGRGRFRSKRSRGDAMGARTSTSRATITGGSSSSFKIGGGGGGGGFGGSGGGGGGGGFGKGGARGKGEMGFRQGTKEYREARINADKLHGVEADEDHDSEEEAMMAALNSERSVLPMGIYRREHRDTGVVVATTAELEAAENAGDEESLWVDGDSTPDRPPPEQPAEEGVWDTGSKKPVVVKKEPEDQDAMDLDAAVKAAPEQDEEGTKVEIKKKKAPPQEPEDRTIHTDLNMLANELGGVTVTENGESRTEGPSSKEGRMYLFQFPPLLPPLKADAAPAKSKVKPEPDDSGMVDAPPAPADPASVDLTREGGSDEVEVTEETDNKQPFMPSVHSYGGVVGKMNVRKSGKVELNWGGRILEMSPATGMSFLTTAVLLEENDEKPAPGVIGGDSMGMGEIMGRFVLSPVWSEEEDWVVAPEELVIEQADE